MTFGGKAKITRKKQFLSQEAMAKELGISFTAYNRLENGKAEPNYATQKAFHEFCVKHGFKFKGEDEKIIDNRMNLLGDDSKPN